MMLLLANVSDLENPSRGGRGGGGAQGRGKSRDPHLHLGGNQRWGWGQRNRRGSVNDLPHQRRTPARVKR